MHIETVKYKVINVGKTEQSGDAISNASPSVVNDAILRNDARLLEIDVTDRICYCLGNHEDMAFHCENYNRGGKFIFDILLTRGCGLLGWNTKTALELKYRLMPDTIFQCAETVKRWGKDTKAGPLTYVIISKDTIKGRKQKDGSIKVRKNIIFYNDKDFLLHANNVIKNREKLLSEKEKKELKRTKNEYLQQLQSSRNALIEKAKSAFRRGRVSLFLGAGVSIDAGLPNWSDLLKGVFKSEDLKPYAYVSEMNTNAILDTYGNSNIIAGRYAFNGFKEGDKFAERIKTVLYKTKKLSSELVNAISEVIVADQEKRINSVITYNFDDLIETRLSELEYKDYNSVYGKNRDTSKYLQIYHVHGMIPEKRSIVSTPILSEKDYHNLYKNNHNWANVVQLYSLNTTTCFFIGLSLTDPNLRRLLDFSFSDEGPSMADISRCPHFAFLKRKMLKGDRRIRVNQEHWRVQEQMLREFGINVIWYDSHSDLPKLIKEIMMLDLK